jgi:uncharacterized membrane protein (UPF0127 family)
MILWIDNSLSRPEPLFLTLNSRFNILNCILLLLAPVVLTGLAGCQPAKESLPPAESQTYFPISVGGHVLQLQLALNPAEQQKGLMHRDRLPEDHGMLFLFDQPDQRSFWMRNTRIPLDIGYFDASGQLVEVYPLFPHDENPVPSKSREILIAVETNRGWYAAHGVQAGASIDLVGLQTALARRQHTNHALRPQKPE